MAPWRPDTWVSDNDMGRSRTSYNLDELRRAADALGARPGSRLLDIGCGYGGLSKLVGDYIDAGEIHGVDIDDRCVDEAASKGVSVTLADASAKPLPFADDYFDVVMTLGMMDYLVSFDGLLREMNRITKPGGLVLVSLPNLSSWHNRLMLLLGYQPRDVEVSHEVLAGVPRGYAGEEPAGHIHIPTLRAFTELLEHHGYATVAVRSGSPSQRSLNPLVSLVDRAFALRPSLARRFYYIGRKQRASVAAPSNVTMPFQSLR